MHVFKWVGRLEGLSFLVLLLVAMPVKYILGNPLLVKYVGWGHGVLFMGYLASAMYVFIKYKWNLLKLFIAFSASLIPLGPWVFEKRLIGDSV